MPTSVYLNEVYSNQIFKYKSVLPSQQLRDFQSGIQKALQSLDFGLSGVGDWGIVSSNTHFVDAIFTEDTGGTGGTSYNNYTYYSHGDSARDVLKTPDFPVYFTDVAGDRIYFGHRLMFWRLYFLFSVGAGGTINPTWEYWKDGAWTAIPGGVNDSTNGFQIDGNVYWAEPLDHERKSLDAIFEELLGFPLSYSIDIEPRYWVRVTIGTTQTFTISKVYRTIYVQELKPRATSPPSTSIQVCPGIGIIDGRAVRVKDITTMDLSACVGPPPGTVRKVIIQLNRDGVLSYKMSAAEADPPEPTVDSDAIKLAVILIYVHVGNDISDGDIDWNQIELPLGA